MIVVIRELLGMNYKNADLLADIVILRAPFRLHPQKCQGATHVGVLQGGCLARGDAFGSLGRHPGAGGPGHSQSDRGRRGEVAVCQALGRHQHAEPICLGLTDG